LTPSRQPTSTTESTPATPGRVDVTITSDPANIAAVRRAIEDVAVGIGLDDAAVGDVGLCVNEALANVMRHAYGGATDRPIEIHAGCEDGGLAVTIRDWGNGVNPASLPPKSYNPYEPGGLGLICLQRMMTRASYVPQPDGMLLVMTKKKDKQPLTQRPATDPTCGGKPNRSERGQQ
jgi:anti-sigma regulatory factor (Ser/Thr protein kinase)